jgi:endonuclease/exonuclease/phosphatase family metal-dependent hydrolase
MFEVSVLTINIWNRQGPWEERRARLIQGIAALEPDIVAMQEVIRRGSTTQAHELTAGLGHHVVFGKARPLDAEADYGNAITSRFPVVSERLVDLPCLGVDEARTLLVTELDTPAGRLPVLVTHFSWRMDHGFVREQQALAVADALDTLAAGSLPPIFAGDLNAAPEDKEIRFLTGNHSLHGRNTRLTDCFAACGAGPGYTFDGRYNVFAEPWKEPPRRIDYILVDGPDGSGRGTPLSAQVVLDAHADTLPASDHYGVFTTIRY